MKPRTIPTETVFFIPKKHPNDLTGYNILRKDRQMMKYDYARISPAELAEINELQKKLSTDDKQVVLLAVEKQFEVAKLSAEELKKINALEDELSDDKREVVLIALAR